MPLGNLVHITSGESPRLFRFTPDGVPYFKVEQLSNAEKHLHSSSTPYHFQEGKTVASGSVVFAKRGAAIALNKVRILSQESFMDTNLMALSPKESLDSEFLFYRLSFVGLWKFADTTSVPQINNKHVKPLDFPLPGIPEQRAIADALGDMDELLCGLDRLIAKKRDLKQAAMQQLLTGQTRLSGFSGEWNVKRLDTLADIISGSTPKTTEPAFWDGGIKWCTPTDITSCSGRYLVETERTISALGLASCTARMLPVGALLLCSRATIGEIKIAGCEICTNQGFKSLICKPGVSNQFLYYKLLTMKQKMIERAIGSTFLEISRRETSALEILTPEFAEQTAIAEVLSDMDAELTALEQRREKTRALKQAMMQELLTGNTRLV